MSLYVDIQKKLSDFELKVKFEVANSQVMALLGNLDSGSDTVLKCIAGIEKPDNGTIILNDKVLFDSRNRINLPVRERKIGYIFPKPSLFPNMTVWENIEIVYNPMNKYTMEELISEFGLNEYQEFYPNELSKELQQKVSIVRMIGTCPEVILFEEPFSMLFGASKNVLEEEILNILESLKLSTVYTTQSYNEVYRLAKDVAIIENGEIIEKGKVKEMFAGPKTIAGAFYLGINNFSNIMPIDSRTLWAKDWGITLKLNKDVSEDVKIAGYDSSLFTVTDTLEQENCVECNLVRVVEDVAFVDVYFTGGQVKEKSSWNIMRVQFTYEQWEKYKTFPVIFLKLDADKIIII